MSRCLKNINCQRDDDHDDHQQKNVEYVRVFPSQEQVSYTCTLFAPPVPHLISYLDRI